MHDTCRDLHEQDVKAHLDDLVAVRQADSGAKTGRSDLFRNARRQRLATGQALPDAGGQRFDVSDRMERIPAPDLGQEWQRIRRLPGSD